MTTTAQGETGDRGLFQTLVTGYERTMAWAIRHERAAVLAALLLAVLVRVLYMTLCVGLDSPPTYDGVRYHRLASNLMSGSGYIRENGQPTAFRPPTYSFFLVGVYWLFGFDYAAGRVAHAIVSGLTCVAIYGLARSLFSKQIALFAMLGAVMYPLFIYMAGEFYPDTVALLPAVLSLRVAVQAAESKSLWWLLLLGFLLGITITLRSTYSLLLPLLILWLFMLLRFRRSLLSAAVIVAGFLIVLSPWIVRNFLVFGEFIPLGSNSGVSVWAGNNPIARGRGTPVLPGSWEGPEPPDRNWDGWSGTSETESSRRFLEAGIGWIRRNPLDFATLLPRKLVYAWSPISYGVDYSRQTSSTVALIVLPPYLIFLALVFVGMWTHKHRWRLQGPLYCAILAVSITAMLFYGATRHAFLMHPSLLIFGAAGMTFFLKLPRFGLGRFNG